MAVPYDEKTSHLPPSVRCPCGACVPAWDVRECPGCRAMLCARCALTYCRGCSGRYYRAEKVDGRDLG